MSRCDYVLQGAEWHASLAVLLSDAGQLLVVGLEECEPLKGNVHLEIRAVRGVLLPVLALQRGRVRVEGKLC